MDLKQEDQEMQILGRYEKRLCILLFVSTVTCAFTTLQVLVTQYIPKHHCDVNDALNQSQIGLLGANETEALEVVLNYTIPWEMSYHGKTYRSRCKIFNELIPINGNAKNFSRSKRTCDSVKFYGQEISAVTEFRLVCDRAWMRPMLSSSMYFGMIIGFVIAGCLADRYGRKLTFMAFSALQFVSVICLSFTHDVVWYGFFFILSGLGSSTNYCIAAVLGAEFVSPKHRHLVYFGMSLGFSVGYTLTSPISYFFRDWRWFLRFTGISGVIFIPYYWLLDESPRWLRASGKTEKAKKILNKVATFNGNKPPVHFTDILSSERAQSIGFLKALKSLGREPVLVFRLVVCCFIWFSQALSYFALAINNNNLSGNRFMNLFVSGLVEICSDVLFYFTVLKWGRRVTYVGISFVLAASLILQIFVERNSSAIIAVAMLGKLMTATAWAVAFVHTGELFPTKTRQTVVFLANVGARIGGVIAPFIVYANENGDTLFPLLISSGLITASCLLCLLLPETANIDLPQSVAEAKQLKSVLHGIKPCARRRQKTIVDGTKLSCNNILKDDPNRLESEDRALVNKC